MIVRYYTLCKVCRFLQLCHFGDFSRYAMLLQGFYNRVDPALEVKLLDRWSQPIKVSCSPVGTRGETSKTSKVCKLN